MSPYEVIAVVAVTFIVLGIPLTGLVIRFALRPMVRDLAAAIRGKEEGPRALFEIARRLERIEGRLDEQDARVQEALEASRFYKELEAGPKEGSDEPR
jgi:hypothetical protein